MKLNATMLEHQNDYGNWEWFKVTRKLSPKESIEQYLEEHDLDYNPEEIKEHHNGWYDSTMEIRAYEIEIE